ncbi:MAG TPA: putative baseplate assembly protein [Candidatus Tenderia sp.]|nr:putative baseplate assembly protein [Candidatus Tenderia sp.]
MSYPIPNLDDRRFDDLVAEATARMQRHLPEVTHLPPGDPAHAFIDLFSWLTETILYRANLIPERQRLAFLNLLQLPPRAARPSRGLVSIDSGPRATQLPTFVPDATNLKAGDINFSTIGDVQPTPLQLQVLVKKALSLDELKKLGIDLNQIHSQYPDTVTKKDADTTVLNSKLTPFEPLLLSPGQDKLNLAGTLDHAYYLALTLPPTLVPHKKKLIKALAGAQLNIGLAPANEGEVEEFGEITGHQYKRQLIWELIYRDDNGQYFFHPLFVKTDSSNGGRQLGVARLVLPGNTQLFSALEEEDPLFNGYDLSPPPLPESIAPSRTVCWLRLRCPEEPDLPLGYLGINAVEVIGQGVTRNALVGIGNGEPNQSVQLPDSAIAADTLLLEVEDGPQWKTWNAVDHFQGHGPDDEVFRLDAATGRVEFGNGINGRRPGKGKRIRAAYYRFGGGAATNLPADSIKELAGASKRLKVRHEWPCSGGADAETVEQAEQRIGAFLNHRNRAVTAEDFATLACTNPINPAARAEVIKGFLPGNNIKAIRREIPGAVSVFVLPPGDLSSRQVSRPTQGFIKDIYAYLQARCVVGTELYVLSPEFVPIAVSISINVTDPDNQLSIHRDVEDAVYRYLWPLPPGGSSGEGWPMGSIGTRVSTSELITQISRVSGVLNVEDIALYSIGNAGWQRVVGDKLKLWDYQLPECLGISVVSGDKPLNLPSGLRPEPSKGTTGIAAPVIPESC